MPHMLRESFRRSQGFLPKCRQTAWGPNKLVSSVLGLSRLGEIGNDRAEVLAFRTNECIGATNFPVHVGADPIDSQKSASLANIDWRSVLTFIQHPKHELPCRTRAAGRRPAFLLNQLSTGLLLEVLRHQRRINRRGPVRPPQFFLEIADSNLKCPVAFQARGSN